MNNLKRVLSLALSGIMLVGMMAVGASAVDFSDADKINNTDAVNTLVSLGVINGKDDGSYAPEEIVTRSQMAKMICVALNGGKDFTYGTKTTPTYTDIKGHWAESYIEYCTSLNIIAGRGDGTFAPDEPVTGSAAAKMMLVAIGYNADTEGMVGIDWEVNTNRLASGKDFYDGMSSLNPSEGLSRDNAAQLIYNACGAVMVKYDSRLGAVDGILTSVDVAEDDGVKTILNQKFKVDTTYGYMTGISYNKDKAEYTYNFSDGTGTWSELTDITTDKQTANLTSDKDFSSLYGMKAKVLSKTENGKTVVYGMYADDTTVLFEGVGDDVDGNKYDGTKIESNTGATSYAFNQSGTATAITSIPAETAFKLIDNNDDGKADIAVTYPVTVAKVTFVNKDKITAGNKTYEFKSAEIYEGVAKDDFVVVTAEENTANQKAVVEKAEVITGKVEASRSNATPVETKVDGTWYKDASTKGGDTYALGEEFDLVIVNGFIYNAKQVTEKASADKVVYVVAVDSVGTGLNADKQKVELMFVDGSKKQVTVVKDDVATAGTMAAPSASGNAIVADTMFTYTIDDDGNYELKQMVAGDYDEVNDEFDKITDGKAVKASSPTDATIRFNDSSVVFVKGSDKVKAVTGADINKWADITSGISVPKLYANNANGFAYAVVGAFTYSGAVPGADGDLKYGWITADSSLVKEDDKYYVSVSLWNGDENVTVLAKSDNSGAVTSSTNVTTGAWAKGTPVSYKDLGDGKIETVTSLASSKDAVKAYAGGKEIEFETALAAEIDDDTVILYVDTAKNEGVTGGEIVRADKDALGNLIKNVYAAVNTGKVTYIIVDTSNNLDTNASTKAITELKDSAGTASMMTVVDETDKTININGKTVTGMLEAVSDGETTFVSGCAFAHSGVDYTVVKNGSSTSTDLEAGDVVRIVAEDGTSVDYTVINVAPAP